MVIVFGVFLITTPVLERIWLHEMAWPVVAYHVIDVPLGKAAGFTFFYWTSWGVPALWITSLTLLVIESATKKRWSLFTIYAAAPFAGAAVYWVAWQGFLIYLSHTLA